jgi:hypothetical protein
LGDDVDAPATCRGHFRQASRGEVDPYLGAQHVELIGEEGREV